MGRISRRERKPKRMRDLFSRLAFQKKEVTTNSSISKSVPRKSSSNETGGSSFGSKKKYAGAGALLLAGVPLAAVGGLFLFSGKANTTPATIPFTTPSTTSTIPSTTSTIPATTALPEGFSLLVQF